MVLWGHAVCWCQCCQSAPWWQWGYGMDRHKYGHEHNSILSMTIWMHRNTVTRSWGPLLSRSSAAITSCFSMIMHGPMSQGSVHNSWKLKMSQFFHGLHPHQTCHSLSMFGMLWRVWQRVPVSNNIQQLCTAIEERDNIPQSTAWSSLCEGDVSRCMRQIVVTPDTDWFSDPQPYFFFEGICDKQMHICIPSHVKSID